MSPYSTGSGFIACLGQMLTQWPQRWHSCENSVSATAPGGRNGTGQGAISVGWKFRVPRKRENSSLRVYLVGIFCERPKEKLADQDIFSFSLQEALQPICKP